MLQDVTPGLEARLAEGRPLAAYNGFDPTADSLHVGHLIPIFGLLHLQRHGNRPIVVVGGGTGMIGDPSFRSADRRLLDRADVVANVAAIRAQLEHFLDFSPGPLAAQMIDNYDWLGPFGLIEFLRDIGRHFTIPYMLAKDSVQTRLEGGLSFTEFSYMLLQSADFLHLYQVEGVELQTGGADQWGNITAGLELIRRVESVGDGDGASLEGSAGSVRDRAHGLSFPLFMSASGKKFGKSEAGGNVWLDPKRTSPFEFYQYWIDSADQDVARLLRLFTLFDEASITRLEREHAERPDERRAQRVLAWDITARVHGAAEADRAKKASEARYGAEMPDAETLELLAQQADFVVARAAVGSALDLAIASGAATSNAEARRLIAQGGLRINDEKVTDPFSKVPEPIGGAYFVRSGKKRLIGRVDG